MVRPLQAGKLESRRYQDREEVSDYSYITCIQLFQRGCKASLPPGGHDKERALYAFFSAHYPSPVQLLGLQAFVRGKLYTDSFQINKLKYTTALHLNLFSSKSSMYFVWSSCLPSVSSSCYPVPQSISSVISKCHL
jgi:hypothetical protein